MGANLDSDVRHSHPQRWMMAGAIITLLQSAALLAGAAIGLSLYTCDLTITGTSSIWQMVRLYYFSNVHCSSQFVVNGSNYNLDGVNDATFRTVIIMSFYTALSSIWFIASVLLLVSATKGKHMRPFVGRNLHWPWIASFILVLILDVNASILYCVDLLSTTEFTTVMGLLNIKPDGNLHELNNDYLSTPPLIMAALTSKGILLWIVDVIILSIMIKRFRELFLMREEAEFVKGQLLTFHEHVHEGTARNNARIFVATETGAEESTEEQGSSCSNRNSTDNTTPGESRWDTGRNNSIFIHNPTLINSTDGPTSRI